MESRIAEFRKLTDRLSAADGHAESLAGTVQASYRFDSGLYDLYIAPDAYQAEGDQLPTVVQATINAAVDDFHRQNAGFLQELQSAANELTAMLGPGGPLAGPEDPELDRLRQSWQDSYTAVSSLLAGLEAREQARSQGV